MKKHTFVLFAFFVALSGCRIFGTDNPYNVSDAGSPDVDVDDAGDGVRGDGGEPDPLLDDGGEISSDGGESDPDGGGLDPAVDGGEPDAGPAPSDAGDPVNDGGGPAPNDGGGPAPRDGGLPPPPDAGPPVCDADQNFTNDVLNCGSCGFRCINTHLDAASSEDGGVLESPTCLDSMCIYSKSVGAAYIATSDLELFVAHSGGIISSSPHDRLSNQTEIIDYPLPVGGPPPPDFTIWGGLHYSDGKLAAIERNGTDNIVRVLTFGGDTWENRGFPPTGDIVGSTLASRRTNDSIALSADKVWWPLNTGVEYSSLGDGTGMGDPSQNLAVANYVKGPVYLNDALYLLKAGSGRIYKLNVNSLATTPLSTISLADVSTIRGATTFGGKLFYGYCPSSGNCIVAEIDVSTPGSETAFLHDMGDGDLIHFDVDTDYIYSIANGSSNYRTIDRVKRGTSERENITFFTNLNSGVGQPYQIKVDGGNVYVSIKRSGNSTYLVTYFRIPPPPPANGN